MSISRLAILAALTAAGVKVNYNSAAEAAAVAAYRRSRFDGQCPLEKATRLHAAEMKRQRRRVRNLWNHGSGSNFIAAVDRLRELERLAP